MEEDSDEDLKVNSKQKRTSMDESGLIHGYSREEEDQAMQTMDYITGTKEVKVSHKFN